MSMNDFWTNAIISKPSNVLFLLIGLTILMHLLLVWPRNLSKKGWKYIDYIWLGAGIISILGISANVRKTTASNWIKIEEARLIADGNSFSFFFVEPKSSHICMKYTKTENSPPDFDETQKEYDKACNWLHEVANILGKIDLNKFPEIKMSDFPEVNFNYPILNITSDGFRRSISEYSKQRQKYFDTKETSLNNGWEDSLIYFFPFLLCFALAIRFAKVSGEIRHESKNKKSLHIR